MNIDDIKKISLVEFLNQLDHQPTGRDSKGLWFYSPCRSERKPSFHVNPRKGVWPDFGSGAGGDIFTLAGELCNSTDFTARTTMLSALRTARMDLSFGIASIRGPIRRKTSPTSQTVTPGATCLKAS